MTVFSADRRSFAAAAVGLVAFGTGPGVRAQDYPAKPVRLVHPYPGGPIDASLRVIADRLSAVWKQPVLVDPRPGASEIIAAEIVAKAPPDGYTLFAGTESTFANNAYLFSKLPYDPVRDLAPISELYDVQFGLIVSGKLLAAHSVAEFAALAKQNPGKFNYASTGVGNALHLGMESLLQATGTQITHVAYRTTGQVIQDMLGGAVDALMGSVQIAAPYAADGRMRMLAISGPRRQPALPSVPTFTEAGFPQIEVQTFVGLAAPAGTPEAILTRLQADFAAVVKSPQYRQTVLEPNGYDAVANSQAQFREVLAAKRPQVQRQMRSLGIKLD